MKDMSTKVWNDLPIEQRKRLHGYIVAVTIREIEAAKREATTAHRKHMESLNSRLRFMKRSMLEWEKETLAASE